MTATNTTTTRPEPGRAVADLSDVAAPCAQITPLHDAVSRAAWRSFVATCAGASVFHDPRWMDAVTSAFGHRDCSLAAWRDGQLVGVLPLAEMQSVFAGRLLVSSPYATLGGALSDDAGVRRTLVDAAVQMCVEHRARLLELRTASLDEADFAVDTRHVRFTRQLPSTLHDLATFLPRKARAAVRQAVARDALEVRHDQALLPVVYDLYCRSMRRLGSLNYPRVFFEQLVEQFGRDVWITVVTREQRPIAGLLSLAHRDTIAPYFLGVDERVSHTGATNLIYYAVMERAVKQQLAWFDFGRTRRDNVGAFNFKRNQGFEPRPLAYQRLAPVGGRVPDLSPANAHFSLARRVWPCLPLTVTRSLGAWVSKSIAG